MIQLPQHIQTLKNYEPGKPVEKIKEEHGLDHVAVLWNSENCFGVSPKANEAIRAGLEDCFLYPDPLSMDAREDVARSVGMKAENIVLGNGSEGVLFNIFSAFCTGDDELLSCDGTFEIAYIWSRIHNIQGVRVPLNGDYRFDLDGLLERITNRTKVIYIANPNNPTGTMVTKGELETFLDKVPEHILVVVDEAYFEFASHLSDAYPNTAHWNRPNVITLRSLSKAYGLAGVRVGFGIGPPELIQVMHRVKLVFEPSTVAQVAAAAAIQDMDFLNKVQKNNKEGLEYYYEELEELGITYYPSYTNFVMMEMSSGEEAERIGNELLKKGVLVRPLGAFKMPQCIRVAVGTEEDRRMFIEKLKEVMA